MLFMMMSWYKSSHHVVIRPAFSNIVFDKLISHLTVRDSMKNAAHSLLVITFFALPASVFAQSASSVDAIFTSVSGSNLHICAVESEGEIICHQNSAAQRLAPPDTLPALVSVDVGSAHACGLTLSGSAVCWGDNDFGQLDSPTDVFFNSLSAGGFHTCGITTSNDVVCWGLNRNGQTEPRFIGADESGNVGGEQVRFVALDLANEDSCGLDVGGNIRCWGSNTSTYRPQSNATESSSDLNVEAFAVTEIGLSAFRRQCGLLSDGTIDCAIGTYTFSGHYTDLAAHREVMCALDLNGDLECQAPSQAPHHLRPWMVESINQINAGDPLVSISGNGRLCGLTSNAAAVCVIPLNQTDPVVPGTESPRLAAPLDLTASIYSDTTVELMWSEREVAPWQIAYAEIFRDGELLSTTTQLRSYLDSTLVPGQSYTYAVRFVAVDGDYGDFSSSITVSTLDRNDPTQPQVDRYTPPARVSEPTDLQASVYSQELLELQWSRVPNAALGYEIRRDGQYMGYTTGVSYLDATISPGGDYVYEVIAVTATGEMLGVAMTRAVVQ